MFCYKGHHRISPILRVSKFRQQRDALKWSHQTLFFIHRCGEGFKKNGYSLTPINQQQGLV